MSQTRLPCVRDAPLSSHAEVMRTIGVEALTDEALLSLLIGPSRRHPDPASLAALLLADGREAFSRRDFAALGASDLLGFDTAHRLAAIQELARRFTRPTVTSRPVLQSPDRVASYLRSRAVDRLEERVGVLCLDTRHRLVSDREVVRGSIESAGVTPCDVLRRVLLDAAPAFIVYHNHPSGDPTPSRDDVTFTKALDEAARQVGLRFLDHVIVGSEGTVSLAARGLITPRPAA